MGDERRTKLRSTFDTAAELYDRVRPRYPAQLFADLADLAGLQTGSRVLEIGSGTGQATVDLAKRGYRMTCVELGRDLAAIGRRNLEGYAAAEVITADFETWPLPDEPFDAVLAATAFHWLDPHTRVQKSAEALRPGGALAIIGSEHVAGGTEQFWIDAQTCYERWDPATEPGLRLTAAADVSVNVDELTAGGYFPEVDVRRYEADVAYTTTEYLDLLLTYSGHIALLADQRSGLLTCIRELIDGRYGGQIVKRYLTTLRVARRLSV